MKYQCNHETPFLCSVCLMEDHHKYSNYCVLIKEIEEAKDFQILNWPSSDIDLIEINKFKEFFAKKMESN